ncbi:MAG: hypothetical protein ACR2NU_15060 [Aeoliella sp.]
MSLTTGCSILLPEVSTMPVVHNPFPQLSQVAVAPFLNLSDEPTVDGRQFALSYFAELQATPGFEVVPLGVVEEVMIAEGIDLSNAGDARRLAQLLGVDAVVVGAVTDFTPYYPPRCGMRVEWYTANPGFHEIPAGYGLPWGTPDEEYIPPPVVFDAEMALARAQMETQSPACVVDDVPRPMLPVEQAKPLQSPIRPGGQPNDAPIEPPAEAAPPEDPFEERPETLPPVPAEAEPAAYNKHNPDALAMPALGAIGMDGAFDPALSNTSMADAPPNWPDPRGFIPPGPSPVPPQCVVNPGPVMTHTRIFLGHDPEFTAALAAYVDFRDDARFGGWRSYLERSDDFIRFCCHLHISEMLTARGGAGETRVVRHWSNNR